MKKIFASLLMLLLMLSLSVTAFASGTVTYDGTARDFIFAPGSGESPTDLFSGFKGVMPGGTLTEQVLIKNDASKEIDNKIVKLSTLIKKSNFVIINIGLVDIESLININENENKLIYDEEILYQKSEVLISNLKQIIDLIYDYNDKIGLFINKLSYNFYTNDAIVINLYKNINNLYEQVAIKKGATLIS